MSYETYRPEAIINSGIKEDENWVDIIIVPDDPMDDSMGGYTALLSEEHELSVELDGDGQLCAIEYLHPEMLRGKGLASAEVTAIMMEAIRNADNPIAIPLIRKRMLYLE